MAEYNIGYYFQAVNAQIANFNWQDKSLRMELRLTVETILRADFDREVAAFSSVVERYQVRYNLIGSVNKTFFTKESNQKIYLYLSIEQAIRHFCNEDVRFMAWLLEHYQYMNFSEVAQAYWDRLNENSLYDRTVDAIIHELYHYQM